jgi:hypothetical protein
MALDLQKLREKYQQKSQGSLMIDHWEPKEGENSIRVLPHSTDYFKGTVAEFVYDYLIHYNLGSERKTAAICPKSNNPNAKCPICEASSTLYRSNDDKDKELASDLYHRRRYLANILNLNDLQKGVQIYEFGPTVYNKLMKYVASGLFGDILDLEKGRNVILSKTIPGGVAKMTNYELIVSPEQSSIIKYLPQDYAQKIDDLGKTLPKSKSYEELKVILEGEETSNGETISSKTNITEEQPIKTETKVTVETPKLETPTCFGKEFSLKSAKCRACMVFDTCKVEFIRLIEEG